MASKNTAAASSEPIIPPRRESIARRLAYTHLPTRVQAPTEPPIAPSRFGGCGGEHAWAAVGVAALANDASVETEVTVRCSVMAISYNSCRDSRFCPNRTTLSLFPKWFPCSKKFFVKRNYAGGQHLVPLE